MHSHILTYIILPNVGYWRGSGIVNKKELSYTKLVLTEVQETAHSTEYYLDGLLHREGDLPAIDSKFCRVWYKKGKEHRKGDNPSYISSITKSWKKRGLYHRKGDLPANVYGDVSIWYKKGVIHRDADKPAVITSTYQNWWKNGEIYKRVTTGFPTAIDLR